MRYSDTIYSIVFLILSVFAAGDCLAESGTDFSKDYEILIQKNIFSKNRIIKISQNMDDGAPQEQTSAANSQLRYVLRGVSAIDGVWVGFFEDITTNLCSIVHVGDEFNKGRIKSISADGLVYEVEQQQINIGIGLDLTGADMISTPVKTTLQGSSEKSDEDNDILKRLMEKRKKELDQK